MEPLTGSLLLSLRLLVPGWLWGAAPRADSMPAGNDGFWTRLGRAVVAGLLLNLLPALFLAGFRIWTPAADWTVWGLIVAAGAVRAFRRGGAFRPAAVSFLAALALVILATSLPVLRPPRSEWLAGGWDPGLYQNNAVVIARQNGLQDRADSIYAQMTPEERALFSAAEKGGYREAFPSVPVRLEDGALPLYFFHLTPVCGAWFLRLGGADLLFRLPAVLALWGLFPVLALGGALGFGGWRRGAVLAAWLLTPPWWYQQAIPTAEMLYLFLLLGGALFYFGSAARGTRFPLGACAALFAAAANHLNVVILGGGLLLAAAAAEGAVRAPRRLARLGACFAALGLGILWDWEFARVIVLRLEAQDRALSVILAGYAAAAGVSLLLAWRPLPVAVRTRGLVFVRVLAVAAGCGAAAVALAAGLDGSRDFLIDWSRRVPRAGLVLWRLVRIIPFYGVCGCVWAGLGLAWLALDRDSAWTHLKLLVFALATVCALLLVESGIALIFPWALRRYFPFLVPLLALVQAFVLVRALEGLRGGGFRRLAGVALLALLVAASAAQARLAARAARVGDYPGFGRFLADLEQAIASGDIVVADDPRWGTPLALAAGRDVINGRLLWQSRDPAFTQQYLEALRRLRAATGRRILWLTSTAAARGIYPVDPGGPAAPLAEIAYVYHTVIHSTRADAYAVNPQARTLRIFAWDGTYAWREDAAP